MGAYMYPITIKRDRQKIRYTIEVELEDSTLTLSILRMYVNEDEKFSIVETDEGPYSKTVLFITKERYETDTELKARVEKEEAYMIEYNKRHSK